jgi:hypothetical protein
MRVIIDQIVAKNKSVFIVTFFKNPSRTKSKRNAWFEATVISMQNRYGKCRPKHASDKNMRAPEGRKELVQWGVSVTDGQCYLWRDITGIIGDCADRVASSPLWGMHPWIRALQDPKVPTWLEARPVKWRYCGARQKAKWPAYLETLET